MLKIFVAVGTDHHRFDRLVEWVDEWCARQRGLVECTVQFGTSRRPEVAAGIDYLPHDELQMRMAGADVVVSHGGPSTIADAWKAGHVPVVVPRDDGFGEHVDDHQMKFAQRLEAARRAHVAWSQSQLESLLDSATSAPEAFRSDAFDGDVAATVARFEDLIGKLLTS